MNSNKEESTSVHEGWDSFWRASEAAAFSAGGLHHPSISAFWEHYFKSLKTMYENPEILDVASGTGAVVEQIHNVYGTESAQLTCLDVSQAAIDRLTSKYPGANGIVSDANSISVADQRFDVATSQFGIEYAGPGAFTETCRVVSDSGHVVFVMHHKDSSIHRECSQNLAAVERTKTSNFIPLAIEFLEHGFRAVGGADRALYEAAAAALSPAVEEIDAVIAEFGNDAADGTVAKLYNDVDKIHSNMAGYDPSEVLDWLKLTERELDAYAVRMQSMCNSALTEEAFNRICEEFSGSGFLIEVASALTVALDRPPLAWVLVANRGPGVLGAGPQPTDEPREKVQEWQQQQVDEAVRAVTESGAFSSPILEARPAWSSPYFAMICQVREQGSDDSFLWAISGECPTDTISSHSAASARDAARHFVLKWQLAAARDKDDVLATAAEGLSRRVQNDSAWI